MKRLFRLFLFLCPALSFGQQYTYYHFPDQKEYEALVRALPTMRSDTQRMVAYQRFALYMSGEKRDSSLHYSNLELQLARRFKLKLWEADALDGSAYVMWRIGDYPGALKRFLAGIEIAGNPANEQDFWGIGSFTASKKPRQARLLVLAQLEFDLATLYHQAGYVDKEFQELKKGEQAASENHDKAALAQINSELGSYYLARHQLTTARLCLERSVRFAEESNFKLFEGDALNDLGNIYLQQGNLAAARTNFLHSYAVNSGMHNDASLTHTYLSLADLFAHQQQVDSALTYVRKSLALTKSTNDLSDIAMVDATIASVFYRNHQMDSAYRYQVLAMAAKDSLNGTEKARQFQNIGFTEQLRIQQLEQEKAVFKTKIQLYSMLVGLLVVFLVALILWRNNRQKQTANALLNHALSELKTTQSQLIQSAKMASLGELTAGIAHEIQNPLNFVNNFSEVTAELATELRMEIGRGDQTEAQTILSDINQNLEKITHHGKRAENIVRGMLEHSRLSSGKKESTDLNQLVNEYIQLAYHGLRAKDNSFKVELKTEFDPQLPPVNIISQEVGRVLLNVLNNAFYAVKTAPEPTVTVYTQHTKNFAVIHVKDNGSGIAEAIRDKVMQPFFTTKPTGEGTGLGLSLSYDIIVNGHQGQLTLQPNNGHGTECIISLPY